MMNPENGEDEPGLVPMVNYMQKQALEYLSKATPAQREMFQRILAAKAEATLPAIEMWQDVCTPNTHDYTERLEVPGGWIYRTMFTYESSVSVALVFVPAKE